MDWDFVKFMSGFLASMTLVLGAVLGVCMATAAWQCAGYHDATGKATKYVRGECYVNDSGAWFAWSEYKNRLVAKGQMEH